MKCKVCKSPAVVALRSHNTSFCENCYKKFFTRQVEKAIKSHKLFKHSDKILVALSGGKDSLSLMLELSLQGYNVTGLHIDLDIPRSSEAARAVVERFCKQHKLELNIMEMAKENLSIPLVKKYVKRPICSACGKVKRHYFNKVAIEQGYDVLATGHNLDDEVARLFSNTVRWDTAYLSDQSPMLESESGFVRKVKPLWKLTEFETANYAFLMGIENHYAPCPYSKGASFTHYKHFWQRIEEVMPGQKINFYQGFLERARPVFALQEVKYGAELLPCISCGFPTSAVTCGVCRIRQIVMENTQ